MLLANLKGKKIVLASKSPRRQSLIEGLDIACEIEVKEVEEIYPSDLPLHEVAEFLAKLKASAWNHNLENQLVITADTVVIHNGNILGKPKDREQAVDMLESLSGQTHEVVTGVAISSAEKQVSFSDLTKVTFAELTSDEVQHYIDKYEPYDKAGSYGAQEFIGYIAITRLEGSYFNVMGLPVHRLYAELRKF